MAVTSAEFLLRFPEFTGTEEDEPGLIDKKLEDAQAFLDVGAFGAEDIYDRAVYYYAAALLTDQPYGQPRGMTQDTNAVEVNRYRKIFKEQILPLIRRRGQLSGGGLP